MKKSTTSGYRCPYCYSTRVMSYPVKGVESTKIYAEYECGTTLTIIKRGFKYTSEGFKRKCRAEIKK